MKGGHYTNAAFESMMENDEMMSEVMVNYMMHNQEVWTQWELKCLHKGLSSLSSSSGMALLM